MNWVKPHKAQSTGQVFLVVFRFGLDFHSNPQTRTEKRTIRISRQVNIALGLLTVISTVVSHQDVRFLNPELGYWDNPPNEIMSITGPSWSSLAVILQYTYDMSVVKEAYSVA